MYIVKTEDVSPKSKNPHLVKTRTVIYDSPERSSIDDRLEGVRNTPTILLSPLDPSCKTIINIGKGLTYTSSV